MRPAEYISSVPRELLRTTAGRRILTKDDPLMFALIYLMPHLIRQGDTEPSLAQFHLDIAEYAKSWIGYNGTRDCWIAPRNSGKTTWLFTLLPLWAAAHGHLKFIAAFSDSEEQASKHLRTFKSELDTNELLRLDYPELCSPLMGGGVRRYIAQSNTMIQQRNGFSFSAKGIDSKSLGMKIGNLRPDLLLLDDIEPEEAKYSAHLAEQRKRTVLDGIFLLNDSAPVAIVGTTTMSNSIIDQIRKVGEYKQTYLSTTQSSNDAFSDYSVNENIDRHSLSLVDTDNIDYVRLDKDYLSNTDPETTASFYPESTQLLIGHRGAESNKTSPESHIEATESATHNLSSVESHSDLSTDTNMTEQTDIDTKSIQLADFATQQFKQGLTDHLTSDKDSLRENDFNSVSSFRYHPIQNSSIEDFETSEQIELNLLQPKVIQNDGESAIQHTHIESLSFYDSVEADLQWVIDEEIRVHYYPAIVVDSSGNEQSWWPEFKPMDKLERIRNTRSFQMNFMNRPVNVDAQYWNEQDIQIEESPVYTRTLISVDPAVSTKLTNDYTAITVVSLGADGKAYIRHAEQVRIVSTALRDRVNELVELFDAGLVLVETNQGGMLWASVFDGISANYRAIHHTEPKSIRAARALDYYRKNQVRHTRHFAELEEQMYSYPKVTHDDLLDSAGQGIHFLLSSLNRPRRRQRSYI